MHFKKDGLNVFVLKDRTALGRQAAMAAAAKINELLREKEEVNIIFAAAPSQNEFLEALLADTAMPWERINAFHMDEYLGLPANAPQLFGRFLAARLFGRAPFKSVSLINSQPGDIKEECLRYASLLENFPPDVVCMGIGENTHLAFNDPPVADFNDKEIIKMVKLDRACRQQQVNDKCFEKLDDVPQYALTLTIPALIQAPFIFCMVPGKLKAAAVKHTLYSPITEQHPSTVLRKLPNVSLFLDKESYALSC